MVVFKLSSCYTGENISSNLGGKERICRKQERLTEEELGIGERLDFSVDHENHCILHEVQPRLTLVHTHVILKNLKEKCVVGENLTR